MKDLLTLVVGVIAIIIVFKFISVGFNSIGISISGSDILSGISSVFNNGDNTSYRKYNIGDTITTDKFEITITKVESKSQVGELFFTETAHEGSIFVCYRIKIKNISNKPIGTFSQPSVYLVDDKNNSYNTDLSASSNYVTEDDVDITTNTISDLNPGVTVRDAGVFEIGRDYFAQNNFNLQIKADETVLVKIK